MYIGGPRTNCARNFIVFGYLNAILYVYNRARYVL